MVEFPHNRITDSRKFKSIKKGDIVWVGRGTNPCEQIAEVIRLDSDLITTTNGLTFRRNNGRQIGYEGMAARYISGIATCAEIRSYKTKQRPKELRDARKQKVRVDARVKLNTLFSGLSGVRVTREWDGSFKVVSRHLSAEQVQKLAPAFRRAIGAK
jgi:hypothetical protein